MHTVSSAHIWPGSKTNLLWNSGETENCISQTVSHDQSHAAHMRTHAFLFAFMTVRPLAAWWWVLLVKCYERSFRTHGQFTSFSALLWWVYKESCSSPNEFFPSNFFLLLSPWIHSYLALMQPPLMLNKEAMQAKETVVTSMRRERLGSCHFAGLLLMMDSGRKISAWHNHSPSSNLHAPVVDVTQPEYRQSWDRV